MSDHTFPKGCSNDFYYSVMRIERMMIVVVDSDTSCDVELVDIDEEVRSLMMMALNEWMDAKKNYFVVVVAASWTDGIVVVAGGDEMRKNLTHDVVAVASCYYYSLEMMV